MYRMRSLAVGAALVAGALAVGMAASDVALAKTVTKTKTTKTIKKKTTKTTSKKRVLPGGLVVEDLKVGTGAVAKAGQTVTVNYRGMLTNGQIFDESYKRHQAFPFTLGAGQVIKGWDMGVAGMKVGGKRKLTIPAALAYGADGRPGIPPNATLIFTVELLKVG